MCTLSDSLFFFGCRAGAWAAYNRLLSKQPMLTKALTSLTGFTVGDMLAQSVRGVKLSHKNNVCL